MAKDEEVEFVGRIIRQTGNSGDWKAYFIEVDSEKYPNIKMNKTYFNYSINGEMHDLAIGQEYQIKAVEKYNSSGVSYKVLNIKRDKPTTKEDTLRFLHEILTHEQADTLYNAYPNIVDKVIKDDLADIDLSKTKGIKEYTFNVIKQKIIENYVLVELIDEFQGMLSLSTLKRMYEKYSSVKLIRKKMREEPYKCLCGLSGVGFKTADSILLELDRQSKENIKNGKPPIVEFDFDLKTSLQRCLASVMYLLEENENNGHTKMDIVELKTQVDRLVPACANHIVEGIKSKYIYFNKEHREIALKTTYETEEYIANTLKFALKNNIVWNYDYKKYKNQGEFELSDEQIEALSKICKYNVSILNGCAGVGKSASTEMIIKMLKDNNKSFYIFAPTGRAAKVIADYTKEPTSTIHRGLGYMPPNEWGFNEKNKIHTDVIIVDEFSMTDIFLCKHLFEAIDFTKTKLLMIGDNAQLPSVSCGNLLHDFMQSGIVPTTTLTKVFRYGEGGLMTVATDVRNSKSFMNNEDVQQVNKFGKNEDYIFINCSSTDIINKAVSLYENLIKKKGYLPSDILVLSPTKKGDHGTPAINNKLQKIANKNINMQGIKVGDTTYYLDDIVMQTVNNYKARLYINNSFNRFEEDNDDNLTFIANGELGKIIEISKNDMIIDFDGVKVIYNRDQIQNLSLGYSMTVHKCITGDTLIYTSDGIKEIQELNNGAKELELKDFEKNIFVYNGKTLEKSKAFYNAGVCDCKKIVTQRGYDLTGTLDHKVDVLKSNGEIIQKPLENIKTGDYILINKNNNIFNPNAIMPNINKDILDGYHNEIKYNLPEEMTESFALLLGMMVADGCITKDRKKITYGKNQKEVSDKFNELIYKLFGKKVVSKNILPKGVLGGMYLTEVNSTYLNSYFSQIQGLQPNNKFVPQCILSSNKNIQCMFLKGIFEDGSVNVKRGNFDHIELCNHSLKLINQLKMMLLNIGIITTYRKRRNNHYIYIYGEDAKIFLKNIGFISHNKIDGLNKCMKEKKYFTNNTIPYIIPLINKYVVNKKLYTENEKNILRKNKNVVPRALQSIVNKTENIPNNLLDKINYLQDNIFIDKVIEESFSKEQCYCLEMPITHKFIQNGIVASNCQGGNAKVIILITPQSTTFMLNSNLIYVGLTRMREKCYHLGSIQTVNKVIKKKENYSRNTFMQRLLKSE